VGDQKNYQAPWGSEVFGGQGYVGQSLFTIAAYQNSISNDLKCPHFIATGLFFILGERFEGA